MPFDASFSSFSDIVSRIYYMALASFSTAGCFYEGNSEEFGAALSGGCSKKIELRHCLVVRRG